MNENGTKTCWHCLVGETLKSLLEPVGIEVRWEVPVVLSQPKADIILIQRKTGARTEEQRLLLADGLRELEADHILVELKITESLNEKTLTWISMHDTLYLETAKLERHQLQSVIIRQLPINKIPDPQRTQRGTEEKQKKCVYFFSVSSVSSVDGF